MASEYTSQGDSVALTRQYFDSLLIEQRLMDSELADTTTEMFGHEFSTPIMTTALSHLGPSEHTLPNGLCEYAKGAAVANTLHWVGMCENLEFEQIFSMGAKTVRIIKPYADEDKIFSQIELCKKLGTVACGIDIDHSFTREGGYDICVGEQLNQKSSAKIREYIEFAKMPYIIKGVLSVHDAAAAANVGAAGIVVSHHNSRMNYVVPPLMILEDIKKEVGDSLKIFVDCGIVSGMDAYKALALGADAVCVGKALMPEIKAGGYEAVAAKIEQMTRELKGVMSFTGVTDMSKFDPTVIVRKLW